MSRLTACLFILLLIIAFSVGYFFPKPEINETSDDLNPYSLNSPLPDFSGYTNVKEKKKNFFSFLLPKVKKANDNILKERDLILELQTQQDDLSKNDQSKLEFLKSKYEVENDNPTEAITELLLRVDIIPASLALAQAANESAWGTSRFSIEGNNLFGQWCYVPGCGIIPNQRHGKQRHEVAKFNSVLDSIESYMRNLNSQLAYEKLRTLRAQAREDEINITGLNLAKGLWGYSIRREAYIHEIQLMIKQNGLQKYNRATAES